MTAFQRPRGLNHVVYITRDTAATKHFYTTILGMRLVSYAQADQVGSTGEPVRFLHTFFEMGDGTCIAFFDIEDLPEETAKSVVPRWAPHLALSLGSSDEVEDARQRLIEHGIEVVGPIDHEGIWTSIYFFDPNGVRLEFTYQNRKLTEEDAMAAAAAVDAWTAAAQPQR